MKEFKFAPAEIFKEILEWAVIPTFDLLIEYGDQGIIIVKRKIAPYKGQWALPGLRMYKGEDIEDTLTRIAQNELGLSINPTQRTFLGQYVGNFKSEHQRQDLSTGYRLSVSDTQEIRLNTEHLGNYLVTKDPPKNMGAMYKYYFEAYANLGRS